MASSRPPSAKLLDLDLTIVSAKHLKNVNWKTATSRPTPSSGWIPIGGSPPSPMTPVLPNPFGTSASRFLSLFLYRNPILPSISSTPSPAKPPNPLSALPVPLKELPYPDDLARIRTFELTRPSGRPQGKIRVKLGLRERPLPPPPPPPAGSRRQYNRLSRPHPHPRLLHTHLITMVILLLIIRDITPRPPPPRPIFDRTGSYGGPSAPVDYSAYDQRQKGGKMGFGTGLAVGAVAGTLGGLALEEGLKYEEEKIADRVENDLAGRDDYSDYRVDY
ncbi:hypothetical protein GH714_012484 [Hevea brasiliensis]|uniref:Uncharacterized protein n=1 Tax=Hevea brasiliensis TaxID=3981 RepID=A0A6A6N4D9_HEVBR|nr:hypothetical protein GH714_012484 [Hevea brasiliensis]